MTAISPNSTGRIALAIALSALIHTVMLSNVRLPPAESQMPPLIARLEPLPEIAARPAPPRKAKKIVPLPVPSAPEETPAGKIEYAPEPQIKNSPTEEPPIDSDSQAIGDPTDKPQKIDKPAEETRPAHVLPKHAQLTFVVYKGQDFEVGKVRHSLEISDDKGYILKVGANTIGIASLFKTFELNQQSSGVLTAQGLRPGRYSETKNTSSGKETNEALFAWEEKLLSFSNGNSTPLPEDTQDIISFLYQLPQLDLSKGTISLYISNGRKLERYQLDIGEEEIIQTRLGRLRALQLHKIHAPGEEGLDIWLGLEYRLLPVKVSTIDRKGQVAGEMVISQILVSDE